MVANSIDAIRHGTLIEIQVQLLKKINNQPARSNVSRIKQFESFTFVSLHYRLNLNLTLKMILKYSQRRFSGNLYRLTTELFRIIHKACKLTMGAIIRCMRRYKLKLIFSRSKHVSF